MLYSRQVLILLVSLYSVRIVLNVLGVEDYGTYNVVGGVVTFFSFLSGTMASATQRFFSFALGQNNTENLKKIFSVNLIIYAAIAILALILLETLGLWYVKEKLRVPPERFEAVIWIYHFSMLTFIATILTSPFSAIIIAHEDMHLYAYASIVEAALKLGIVFLLFYLPGDKLELYGALIFAVAVINALVYVGIGMRKYAECQFRKFYWDKGLLHEVIGYTGWTLFGQTTSVLRNQAITILLNQVFNPVVVAARAISMNITSQINLFSNNFNVGLYPPIVKAYAANDKKEMDSLVFNGSKITFFLLWVFALPVFLEMDVVLNLWLKNPPPGTVLFTRLALVEVLINSLSLPIMTAARAPGRMKIYELTLGLIQVALFVSAWIVLKMGGAAYTVLVVAILANMVMFIVRLLIVNKLTGLPVKPFMVGVVVPVLKIILLSSIPAYLIHILLRQNIIYTAVSILSSITLSTIAMYYIGLNRTWKDRVRTLILRK